MEGHNVFFWAYVFFPPGRISDRCSNVGEFGDLNFMNCVYNLVVSRCV